MFVTQLHLTDFRSYTDVDLALGPGVTVFTGANGQGKTNLVEAVEFLATLGSHRVATEAPLIRFGADQAVLRARVQASLSDDRSLSLELHLLPKRANKAWLNRAPLRRPRDLLGALRVVLFSPEDLAIVKGDPSERRRFIDDLVVARWPRLAGVKADYERILRQRTAFLKSWAGRGVWALQTEDTITLEIWDQQLASVGAELIAARLTTLAELRPILARTYLDIAPTNNDATIEYRSSTGFSEMAAIPELVAALTQAMASRRGEEIARGSCLVGPHRDDLGLSLGELPARGYASHGESWSIALALRLAAFHLLRGDGLEPVLILDDVFAELDEQRRTRLAELIADAEQVLITAAVAADVPDRLGGVRFQVAAGTVSRERSLDEPG